MSNPASKLRSLVALSIKYFSDTRASLDPRIAIVHVYTLIAAVYCSLSAILFYYPAKNIILSAVHLLTFLIVLLNYLVLIRSKNLARSNTVILSAGIMLAVSLFATGGWDNTGYLWPFIYLQFAFFISTRPAFTNVVVATFSGCLLVTILHFSGVITIPYSAVAIGNYFAALILYIILTFVYQKANARQEEFISSIEALIDAAPDAVIVIDDEGVIVKWNRMAESMFGWTSNEVTGTLLSSVIIPLRYREEHRQGMGHFLRTGEGPVLGRTVELQAIRKNRDEFDVSLSISPNIINGKYQFIGFIRDITEKKNAEIKIKEQELNFATLFYKSPVMKAIAEKSTGKYIDVNDAFAEFLECRREEILGKTSVELNLIVRPVERERSVDSYQKDGFARDVETKIITKMGKIKWVSTSIDTINMNGRDFLLTSAIDITERKESQENGKN